MGVPGIYQVNQESWANYRGNGLPSKCQSCRKTSTASGTVFNEMLAGSGLTRHFESRYSLRHIPEHRSPGYSLLT